MEVEICVIEQFDRKEVLVLHVDKCHDISKDLHQVHEVFHVSLFEILEVVNDQFLSTTYNMSNDHVNHINMVMTRTFAITLTFLMIMEARF